MPTPRAIIIWTTFSLRYMTNLFKWNFKKIQIRCEIFRKILRYYIIGNRTSDGNYILRPSNTLIIHVQRVIRYK